EQAITILASLFAWSECESRILSAAAALDRPANLQMPLPELIMAGARRAVESRQLPAARARLEGSVSRSAAARAARLLRRLDPLEAAIYARTSNHIGVAELVAQARNGSARPEEIVARLILLGLITLESAGARPAETPAPGSRAPEARLGEQV